MDFDFDIYDSQTDDKKHLCDYKSSGYLNALWKNRYRQQCHNITLCRKYIAMEYLGLEITQDESIIISAFMFAEDNIDIYIIS